MIVRFFKEEKMEIGEIARLLDLGVSFVKKVLAEEGLI